MDAAFSRETAELSVCSRFSGQLNVGLRQDRHCSPSGSDDDPVTSLHGSKGLAEVGLKFADTVGETVHAYSVYAYWCRSSTTPRARFQRLRLRLQHLRLLLLHRAGDAGWSVTRGREPGERWTALAEADADGHEDRDRQKEMMLHRHSRWYQEAPQRGAF